MSDFYEIINLEHLLHNFMLAWKLFLQSGVSMGVNPKQSASIHGSVSFQHESFNWENSHSKQYQTGHRVVTPWRFLYANGEDWKSDYVIAIDKPERLIIVLTPSCLISSSLSGQWIFLENLNFCKNFSCQL